MRILAVFALVSVVTPTAFLVAPPRAHATWPVANIPGIVADALSLIQETISAINDVITSAATYASFINDYVLQPMLYIMSGNMLRDITANIVKFVSGGTNGTGKPQFVQDLLAHLQRVGDIRAGAFLNQLDTTWIRSNSPWASSIHTAVVNRYLEQTSSVGFLEANQDTLATVPGINVNAYLNGDWQQGGLQAWFALTTEDNNNPYIKQYNTEVYAGRVIGAGTAARNTELQWGQGFLPFCGKAEAQAMGQEAANNVLAQGIPGTDVTSLPATPLPDDPCMNADGSVNYVKTLGATIKNELDEAIFLPIKKLLNTGNMASEVTSIMQNIGTIMNTIDLASQLLDGGGLSGITQSSATDPNSRLQMFQSQSGYLNVTQTQIQNNANANAQVTTISNQVSLYTQAWNAIQSVAQSAVSAVNNLINACPSQATGAQYALTNIVNPALSQAASATIVSTNANAMIQQVKNDITANSTALTTDMQTLQSMPPSAADTTTAQQQAQNTGAAIDNPPGSLFISGGTLMDRLTLVNLNAVSMTNSSTTCP